MQCNLPLSQSDLADTLGLSLVHTNRSLQALRAEGLIRLESRLLTIIDFPTGCKSGPFQPTLSSV
jgi:CRP-like cAMP-binding protein